MKNGQEKGDRPNLKQFREDMAKGDDRSKPMM